MLYLVRAAVDLEHDSVLTLCYQSINHVSLFCEILIISLNDSVENNLDIQSHPLSPQWTL